MHIKRAVLVLCAIVAVTALVAACSKKGGEGAACQKPADCRRGFRCEDNRCIGGGESACGYILRCMPKLSMDDKETLFGGAFNQFYEMVKKSPQQAACEARLNLIVQMGRQVVLNRACGPRVME
jgi:hypothetical protein